MRVGDEHVLTLVAMDVGKLAWSRDDACLRGSECFAPAWEANSEREFFPRFVLDGFRRTQ
jgi:hypothetical protein